MRKWNLVIANLIRILIDPYGRPAYERLRTDLVDRYGYDVFRSVQRVAFRRLVRMYHP